MKSDSFTKFEKIICDFWQSKGLRNEDRAYWDDDNMPVPEYRLLDCIVKQSIADGDVLNTRNGALAKGLDMWIAGELRAAGFVTEQPWPRLHQPRTIDPSFITLLDSAPMRVRDDLVEHISKAGSSDANVQGAVYEKQVDVGMSSWLTGPEILISTKTMTREYGKNLKNRFEEAYGDAVNLRRRYPMAALGFFFMLNVEVLDNPGDFNRAVAMLSKLQGETGVYDTSALMLADLSGNGDVYSPENENVPYSLSVPRFFERIIDAVLVRGPMSAHQDAMNKAPLISIVDSEASI